MQRSMGLTWSSSSHSTTTDVEIINPDECDACKRIGPPGFHSTRYYSGDPPEWEALAGSSLFPVETKPGKTCTECSTKISKQSSFGSIIRVFDPRSRNIKRLNRLIVLARGISLAVDPLFLLSVTVAAGQKPCVYIDGRVAAVAMALRTCVDAVHLAHLWLKFRLAYVSRESLVIGNGKLVWDPRAIPAHYVRSVKGFWLDVFVILPIPQVVYCLWLPKLLRDGKIEEVMTISQLIFLLQLFPKLYHSFYLMRGIRKVTGYIFGTVWWGFTLNVIAYFLSSHLLGGYWYILSMRRVAQCVAEVCDGSKQCSSVSLTCPTQMCFNNYEYCNANSTLKTDMSICLGDGDYRYGIYTHALPLIHKNSVILNILYSFLWGFMGLSSMGNNLEPTSESLQAFFSTIMVLAGLFLFSMLVGNIQVFLHAVSMRRRKSELRYRDMQWWMRRRRLPSRLRRRVRHFEHHSWTTMGGEDEMELIKDLPDGLRRDIKRYLCLDLVKKVPLFHKLDDLILDHICDRVKPIVLSRNEKIIKEGDPVKRMLFIVKGRIERTQNLSKGMVATNLLESGGFFGDELLSWSLRRQYVYRLPVSSATFTCIDATEAFALDSDDLLYIVDHFRYAFLSNKLKSTTRYYSSNWRTWAAVNIQFAWRRYLRRTRGDFENYGVESGGDDSNQRVVRRYASFFMSIRPHDHLE